jgi:NADH-quinone oxidoreductase subunit L
MRFIVLPIRDPIARFAYWTNQKILDGVVNVAGMATLGLGNVAYRRIDQSVIDGAVNGLAFGAGAAGNSLKFWQTGNIQRYAAAHCAGIAFFIAAFIVFRL